MTRYELRNARGERWPDQPAEGFQTASEAVAWAVLNAAPVDWWPYPMVLPIKERP